MQKVQPASFADLSYREKKKQTRREKFLAQMDAILPWEKLLGPIERSYPKGRRGHPPVGVERKVEFTAASVHDSQLTEQLLEGETVAVYGDKAYVDGGKKKEYNKRGVKWRVSRKAKRGRKLSSREKMYNGVVNSVRARVEHAFGVVKNLWGYNKTRYRGLEKNGAQMFALFGLANFYMVRKKLLELQEESCA